MKARIVAEIEESTKKAFKVACVEDSVQMSQVVEQLIEKYLKERKRAK